MENGGIGLENCPNLWEKTLLTVVDVEQVSVFVFTYSSHPYTLSSWRMGASGFLLFIPSKLVETCFGKLVEAYFLKRLLVYLQITFRRSFWSFWGSKSIVSVLMHRTYPALNTIPFIDCIALRAYSCRWNTISRASDLVVVSVFINALDPP